MAERIKVEYFEEPPVVLEVGGRRSWQAETADQFCNIWHETTEGSDHVTRWVKSSYDGRMVREMTAEEVAAECRSSLRVRTENPARALALLEEAYPALAFKAEPDGALVVAGDYDDGAISRLLARSGEVVRELSQDPVSYTHLKLPTT